MARGDAGRRRRCRRRAGRAGGVDGAHRRRAPRPRDPDGADGRGGPEPRLRRRPLRDLPGGARHRPDDAPAPDRRRAPRERRGGGGVRGARDRPGPAGQGQGRPPRGGGRAAPGHRRRRARAAPDDAARGGRPPDGRAARPGLRGPRGPHAPRGDVPGRDHVGGSGPRRGLPRRPLGPRPPREAGGARAGVRAAPPPARHRRRVPRLGGVEQPRGRLRNRGNAGEDPPACEGRGARGRGSCRRVGGAGRDARTG